jgi:uncharacterized membrane protein YfcA
MAEWLGATELSWVQWVMAVTGIFLLGIAKGGIKGLGPIITAMIALVFGGKASTGIIMPLLMVGDVFAVIYYNRHAKWPYLWKLMPWMIVGILIGVWFGKDLPDDQFRRGMAILIFSSVCLMWLVDRYKEYRIPDNRILAAGMGSASGFATMVGNLAGPFSELYFLTIRMPKEAFIGTAAWLFFLTNIIKLPFHIWSWGTVNTSSLRLDLLLLPALLGGLLVGIWLVKRLNQAQFRGAILILTALGAIVVFFSS